MRFFFAAVLICTAAHAQWNLQNSNTTASLRGISSLGQGIAWASGSKGTILRTVDGGQVWQTCPIPPDSEKLDFRGIQALSKDSAIIMSAGTGELSRIFLTIDGCRTWKLLFANPDKEGFFDSILYDRSSGKAFILGDPVSGNFALFSCELKPGTCSSYSSAYSRKAVPKQAAFAASNSLLVMLSNDPAFVTGGTRAELITARSHVALPFPSNESSGAFSIASHGSEVVVVGGNYKLLDSRQSTAAFSNDGGRTFSSAQIMPSGYRSAVAYDSESKQWIAVGPNGTDMSSDGRNWHRLSSSNLDDKDWNALSLPFVVGSHGRIAKMNFKSD